MITYKLHFIRTGRTSTEPGKRYVGQSDPPLCPEGIEELERLCRENEYPRAQMVFASPLRRCTQTAEILYPHLFSETVEGLADMNLGRFEGKSFEELRGDEAFSAWLKNSLENSPPGGEATDAFTERIVEATHGVFRRMMEERLTSVAVITHGGVIMSLLAGIGLPKLPLPQWAAANGAGYTVLFTPQMWMRDRAVEVYAAIPAPQGETGDDEGVLQ